MIWECPAKGLCLASENTVQPAEGLADVLYRNFLSTDSSLSFILSLFPYAPGTSLKTGIKGIETQGS